MHNGDVLFKRLEHSAAESARAESWFNNARVIVACGNIVRLRMTASFLRDKDDRLYVKFERITNPEPEILTLSDNVYLQTSAGAALKGLNQSNLKPGIHEIHSIIRMCRTKNLQDTSQEVWATRRSVLRGLADLHNAFDEGLYEASAKDFNISTADRSDTTSAKSVIRIDEMKLQAFINEWVARARRTKPIDKKKLETSINELYQQIGLPSPRLVYASNPLIFVIAASFAAALAARNSDSINPLNPVAADRQVNVGTDIYRLTVQKAFTCRDIYYDRERQAAFDKRLDEFQINQFRTFPNGIAGDAVRCAMSDAIQAIQSDSGGILNTKDFADFTLETKMAREIFKCTVNAVNWSRADGGQDLASGAADTTLFDQLTQTLTGGSAWQNKALTEAVMSCRSILRHCNTQEYDEFQVCALSKIFTTNPPNQDLHEAMQKVWNECGLIFMHRDFCIVSEYPHEFHVNENGALHNEEGPSLRWRDGWQLYHLDGIRVNKQLVEAPETITVDDIENEENIEIRRLMLDRYGIKEYLVEVGAKEIDRDQYGVLYRHVVHDAIEPLLMVEVTNSTPEADGTFKKYFLRVPPHINTAKAAVAWTFNMNDDEYAPVLQT
ncbi:MAG: hypothetical protein EKK48_01585 [Candidatus Melainabacteria bacterium]|nr:MAG: hypothetical protein EKK48_01585 [Candidatus Melainabacteria bacterium]